MVAIAIQGGGGQNIHNKIDVEEYGVLLNGRDHPFCCPCRIRMVPNKRHVCDFVALLIT